MISIESEERPWGRFFVLHDEPSYKLKRIEVDQNNDSISEVSVCKEKGIGLIEGLGDKIQSSSWLLKK